MSSPIANSTSVIGLDIGGANIKVAVLKSLPGQTEFATQPFPLWKQQNELSSFLQKLLHSHAEVPLITVTMTGELCDCFTSKPEGVRFIAQAIAQVAQPHQSCWYYDVDGQFHSLANVLANPTPFAASNWHATANYCRRFLEAPREDHSSSMQWSLLVDIGTTTTDLIPLSSEAVKARGRTDLERMLAGELVYNGVRRTPVAAVADEIELRGVKVRLAAELFAMMEDVYLVLGWLKPDPDRFDTADGQAADVPFARRRLARMLCADPDELKPGELDAIANQIHRQQLGQITAGMEQVMNRFKVSPDQLILLGSGAELFRTSFRERFPDLPCKLPDELFSMDPSIGSSHVEVTSAMSEAAPAYAVAKLLQEDRRVQQVRAGRS